MSFPLATQSSPFDAVAVDYDRLFTFSSIGRAQRSAVWAAAAAAFRSSTRILEMNCGTGVDAVYLAGLGLQVLAIDSSPGMLAIAQDRVWRENRQHEVRLRQWRLEELDRLPVDETFDGAFSNFGGLNCVADLKKFSQDLAKLLKPGSPILLCLLNRWCLWEILYHGAQLRFRKAFRRLNPAGVLVQLGRSRSTFRVCYPSIPNAIRAMQPYFRYRSHLAVGLFVPPSYLEARVSSHPRVLQTAGWIDDKVAGWPILRGAGDHVLICFERTEALHRPN